MNVSGPRRRIAVVGPLTGGSLSVGECAARALRRLGHQVTYVDNSRHMPVLQAISSGSDPPDIKQRMRDGFLDMVRAQSRQATTAARPEVVLFMAQAPAMRDEDVEELRVANVPTIFWFVEDRRTFTYWRNLGGRFDHFWTIQPVASFGDDLRAQGQRFVDHVPLACDPELHQPRPASDATPTFEYEVSFVGTPYPNRLRLLQALADLPGLRLLGPDWSSLPALRPLVARDGPVSYNELPAVFSGSRINLNFSSEIDARAFDQPKDFVNPRAFEICACGGFQLCESLSPVQQCFTPGEELETFAGPDEARDKIRYYLGHESDRQRIAAAGRRRALAEHTYDRRLEQALDRAARNDPRLIK